MLESMEAMKTALRVLTAINERRYPDPEDVHALRRYAPNAASLPVDELACEVIQQAMKVRAKIRGSSATDS